MNKELAHELLESFYIMENYDNYTITFDALNDNTVAYLRTGFTQEIKDIKHIQKAFNIYSIQALSSQLLIGEKKKDE